MQKNNVMKNTTDGAAGLAIVLAAFVLFVAYNKFEPSESAEKLWDIAENAVYIGVAGSFIISLIANIFSRRSPFVGLAFSLLPIWYTLSCFYEGMLTGKNPMIYVILALVHLAGSLIYTVQWATAGDDIKRKTISAGIGASLVSIFYFLLCALVLIDKKYGEPLIYLRSGFIFCAICGAIFSALLFVKARKTEEKTTAAAICSAVGSAFSLTALVFEFIF